MEYALKRANLIIDQDIRSFFLEHGEKFGYGLITLIEKVIDTEKMLNELSIFDQNETLYEEERLAGFLEALEIVVDFTLEYTEK